MDLLPDANSSTKGFSIKFYIVEKYPEYSHKKIKFVAKGQTKDYVQKEENKELIQARIIIVFTSLLIIYLTKFSKMDIVSMIIWACATIPLLSFFVVLTKALFFENEVWKKWHALEHKLIYLYLNKIKVTKEALKLAPASNKYCGIRVVVLFIAFLIPLLIIYIVSIFISFFSLPYMLFLFIVFWLINKRAIKSAYGNKIFVDVSMWLQRHFTTKEPYDWQIEQAVELANILNKQLELVGYKIDS